MGDTTTCDHPVERREHSIRIWLWGLLTDWRYWAFAIGFAILGAAVGALGSSTGWSGGHVGGGAMAALAIYTAMTIGRISRCGQCGETVRVPLGARRVPRRIA